MSAASGGNPRPGTVWSIGWLAGSSPLALRADPEIRNPILTAADVRDVRAELVADPFLIRRRGCWYLFFEILVAASRKGVIGLATSQDARRWNYEGIVLDEPFHLSYPLVFVRQGQVYMLPETIDAGCVRLYRATAFPREWELVAELIVGRCADPTLLRWGGRWWLFVGQPFERHDTLRLYHADSLSGPWREHPRSPIVKGDPRRARPAGRLIDWDGRLIRFAQDCVPHYGSAVRGFEVLELTESSYRERPTAPEIVLSAGQEPWNRGRMHHVDAHEVETGRWCACVDGTAPLE